jgi:hypothetical protein
VATIMPDTHIPDGAQVVVVQSGRRPRWKGLHPVPKSVIYAGIGTYRATRFTWRHRQGMAPLIATGAAGVAAAVVPAVGGWPAVAGLTAVGAGELALRLRRPRRLRKSARWWHAGAHRLARRRALTMWGRIYTAAVWAACFGWLLASTATGHVLPSLNPTALAWELCGLATLAAPWWASMLWPKADPAGPEYDHHAVWDEFVGCPGGALPGSRLDFLDVAPGNTEWSADIVLPRGKGTATAAGTATVRERIASAYGVPAVSVNVERHPGGAEDRAHIAVYNANPLQAVKEWPGPQLLDPKTGTAPIGVFADGFTALYRFWRPGSGPVHDLIAGTTDAGKSRLVDMLLAYERHCGHVVSWVIDPQRGQSLPDWQGNVDWFASSAEEGLKMLRRALVYMYGRNAMLAQHEWVDDQGRKRRGVAAFDPVKLGMPILSITIDEAHALFKHYPEAVLICEQLATMGRKCGIRLRVITQVPTLDQLGNSGVLREMLASGNVIVLRTGGPMSGQVALHGTLPVEPHKIPKQWPDGSTTSGLAFGDLPAGRTAMLRTYFTVDPYHWATTGETPTFTDAALELMEDWYKRRDAEDKAATPEDAVPAPAATAPASGRGSARADILAHLRANGQSTNADLITQLGLKKQTVASSLARLAEAGLIEKVGTGVWKPAAVPAAA